MNIEITCKPLTVTPSVQEHIEGCINKLIKIDSTIVSAHIIIDKLAKEISVEAKLLVPGSELFAKAEHTDFQTAMNRLTDKLKQQLVRRRGKQTAQRTQAA